MPTMNTHMTREAWLVQAVDRFARAKFADVGKPLPERIHVSVGFPSRGGLRGARGVTVGQCWTGKASADGAPHVFVSPLHVDGLSALDTLMHELAHAALPPEAKHGAPFVRLCNLVGLTADKPKSRKAGAELRAELERLNAELGIFPHAALDAKSLPKAGGTRLVKCMCETCGYTVRVTRVWLDGPGAPICPACEVQMGQG